MTNPDILFVDKIKLPRFAGFGMFNKWVHNILKTNQI